MRNISNNNALCLGRRRRLGRLVKQVAYGAMAGVVMFTTAGLNGQMVLAATGDYAYAKGQFLSGSILGIDLDTIAELVGSDASFTDGTTPGASVTNPADLELAVLESITVDLLGNGLSLPLNELLALGAVNQYAQASSGGEAHAAAGAVTDTGAVDTTGGEAFPASAKLDLMAILPATTILTAANLDLRAISSAAHWDAGEADSLAVDCTNISAPSNCRDYNIADAILNLDSPLVGDIVTEANGALGVLSAAVNALQDEIVDGLLGGVTDVLGVLNGLVPGLSLVDNDLSVTINANIAAALAPILAQPIVLDGVTIDLSAGTVAIDLAEILDGTLNDLAPNTSLLSAANLQTIVNRVAAALAQVQTEINSIFQQVVDAATVQVTGGVCLLEVLGCTAGLDVSFDGTLGDLIDSSADLTIAGTGALALPGLNAILGTVVTGVQRALAEVVEPLITNIVEVAGETLAVVVTAATNALNPLLLGLENVIAVNLNVQDEVNGAYLVTALQIELFAGAGNTGTIVIDPSWDGNAELELGRSMKMPIMPLAGETSVATLNLATSVVGPNVANAFDSVSLAATNVVTGAEDTTTTVSGGGWPANTEVTLQLRDAGGNAIGAPVTVTTDAGGNIPAGTTVTVPAGTAVGNYQVTGTTAGGESATANFQVSAAGAPVIESPAGGTTVGAEPEISGTGVAGQTVTVIDESNSNAVLCTAVVADDSTWSCTPGSPLGEGSHTISATQSDGTNTSAASNSVTFEVDATAPAAPEITSPADGDEVTDNTPTISGTGEDGATVTVRDESNGGEVVCTAVVSGGTWSCDAENALTDGDHELVASQEDAAGNVSDDSDPVTITVNTQNPEEGDLPGDGGGIGVPNTGAGVMNGSGSVITGSAAVVLALVGGLVIRRKMGRLARMKAQR